MRNLNQLTASINKAINAVTESTEKNSRVIATAINEGFALIEKNPDGSYTTGIEWASTEFDYSKQTCYKMRSVAINFLTDAQISDNLRFCQMIELASVNPHDVKLAIEGGTITKESTQKELRVWAKSLKTIGMEDLPKQEETEQEETEQEETEQEETEQETETRNEITDTVQNIIKLLKTMDKTTIIKVVY
jgi:hypothetical protein